MNKHHQKRIGYVIFFGSVLLIGVSLILYAFKQNINAFLTPHEVTHSMIGAHFRLGGLVKQASLTRSPGSLKTSFIVTDNQSTVLVQFTGILPDLFREGKGVIAEGTLNSQGIFIATQVLAKHDENYMPKKVYQTLRATAG